jgi:DNA-binding GntR family transcriptional regulator
MTKKKKNMSLVDVAYKKIKLGFVRRELKPGQKLVVQDLVNMLNISPTPIRQALNRLVADSLVENAPGKGFYFKEITNMDINEYFEMRLLLETSFLGKILNIIAYDDSVIGQLNENIEEHWKSIENLHAPDAYMRNYEIDNIFHKIYMRCVDNRIVNRVYNGLAGIMYSYYIFGKQPKNRLIETIEGHIEIVKAFHAQDEALAKSLISDHIKTAWEAVHLMLKIDQVKIKPIDSVFVNDEENLYESLHLQTGK